MTRKDEWATVSSPSSNYMSGRSVKTAIKKTCTDTHLLVVCLTNNALSFPYFRFTVLNESGKRTCRGPNDINPSEMYKAAFPCAVDEWATSTNKI